MIKKNRKYVVLAIGVLILLSGFTIYQKVFNAKHREIFEEPTEFNISADELQFHFANNQDEATKKYLNKVIETNGLVTEIDDNTLVLENRVHVYFMGKIKHEIIVGDNIKIKGRCVGFDELLLTVKLDQATTIKTN